MNYIGSKKKLLSFLHDSIKSIVWNETFWFADLFAGTWIVGRFFKKNWHRTVSNDLQYYSYVLNRHYIGNNKPLLDRLDGYGIFKTLNDLPGIEWFVFNNYCPSGKDWRTYFTDENGRKCDAIRTKIEEYRNTWVISEDEYFFLLASLLESIDKVANTASVYGAYLKSFKKSSKEPLFLIPCEVIYSENDNKVFNASVNDSVVLNEKYDVVYLDPPYNARQYGGNYHVLETIALYDNPETKGKTWMRVDSKKSSYCSKVDVKKSFEDLISKIDANYIFVSYNNEGLLSLEEMKDIMSTRGEYGLFTKEYQRFKADKDVNRNFESTKTFEYLHYVKIKKDPI